jgi:signal transduction histidine kinase/CheY-like chemotaxis protein
MASCYRQFTMSAPGASQAMAILDALAQGLAESSDANGLLAPVHTALERGFDATEILLATHGAGADDADVLLQVRDGKAAPGRPRRLPRETLGPAGSVLATGHPLLAAHQTRHGDMHWLAVPLAASGTTFGMLAVARGTVPFAASDDTLLAVAGRLVALAVYTARLHTLLTRDRGNLDAALEQLVVGDPLRALGRMAAVVAHDLNNTLAAILLRTEILTADLVDPQLARHVTTIQALAKEGGNSVRRLHEFARARTTRAFQTVDLNQLLDEVLELTRNRWKDDGRGSAWDVRTEKGTLPPIAGEPPALREALMHVIVNALEAMPDGGRLTLRTAHADERVVCEIEDTGRGMSPDVQRRATEPFFTTTGDPGRGVGLAIVHGVMTRHGGQVELQSAPGRGAIVTLRFPAADPAAAGTPTRPPGRRAKVLVIDDDPFVRQVVVDILEQHGHEVVACPDGPSGVECARAEAFDLVLSDLGLPGMSGWDVARAVKAAGGPPVVLMTGWSGQVDEGRARAHGVDRVLSKPLSTTTLQSLLTTILTPAR